MLKWLWLSAAVIVLDQITKYVAERALVLYAPVEVTPFFNLTLVYNPGAAFSFLGDASGWQRWFFVLVAVGASVFIVWWLRNLHPSERWTAASLALILGGALGNVIDRLWHGHVVDFVDVHWAGYHWPAFNVADSAITVGAVILVGYSLFFARNADTPGEGGRQ
jgi:signal peptidase II